MRLLRVKVRTYQNKQVEHLINPEAIGCVVLNQEEDGSFCLSVFLMSIEGSYGAGGQLRITDPPSIDRILDLEKTD